MVFANGEDMDKIQNQISRFILEVQLAGTTYGEKLCRQLAKS